MQWRLRSVEHHQQLGLVGVEARQQTIQRDETGAATKDTIESRAQRQTAACTRIGAIRLEIGIAPGSACASAAERHDAGRGRHRACAPISLHEPSTAQWRPTGRTVRWHHRHFSTTASRRKLWRRGCCPTMAPWVAICTGFGVAGQSGGSQVGRGVLTRRHDQQRPLPPVRPTGR